MKKFWKWLFGTRKKIQNTHNIVLQSKQLPCGDCENYAEYDGAIKYYSVCGRKLS